MRCAHRRLEPREQYGVVERRADLADAAADVLRGTSVENDARRLVAGIARARADRIVERECARAADEGAIELSCRDGDVLPACGEVACNDAGWLVVAPEGVHSITIRVGCCDSVGLGMA